MSQSHNTTLDTLKNGGLSVISMGKIYDIFNGQGLTESNKSVSNHDGMEILKAKIKSDFTGLCFVNLVDFDALYGHRRDPIGYKNCLEEFDKDLENFINLMQENDLLIITADHGNDPTWQGTDHTREYVPILIYTSKLTGKQIKDRASFADIGQTICENFGLEKQSIGTSFLGEIK